MEPVRKAHFMATFNGPSGGSNVADNYLLRSVVGLDQSISAGSGTIVNYPISYPQGLQPAEVTLRYILLTDKGGRKSTLRFWQDWKAKVYDMQKDLPALFNECTGSGEIRISLPDGTKTFQRYTLDGCWPRGVVIDDLDRGSADPLGFTVNLVVTRVSPED